MFPFTLKLGSLLTVEACPRWVYVKVGRWDRFLGRP